MKIYTNELGHMTIAACICSDRCVSFFSSPEPKAPGS